MTVTGETTRSGLQAAVICEVDDEGNEVSDGVRVSCMFNPHEYIITKRNNYSERPANNTDIPNAEFRQSGAQELKLTLQFDTYEERRDVTTITSQLAQLMLTRTREDGDENEKIPPPQVAFVWGAFRFVAYITSITQRFTLFLNDGTPVRAKVDVVFRQYVLVDDHRGESQNPTSGGGPIERMWRVRTGDRLDTIAAAVYGDASRWRLIAERNQILDPLRLRPGQQLAIPGH